jgi:hypothetical protein
MLATLLNHGIRREEPRLLATCRAYRASYISGSGVSIRLDSSC